MKTRLLPLLFVAATALAACRSTSPDMSPDMSSGTDLLAVGSDPDALVAALRAANADFAEHADSAVLAERAGLATKQAPPVAVLACADSRAAPEWVFGQRPGRLFVVREAGNIADTHAIASLEYSVAKLHSPVIVVLGHSACGAVSAAASGKDPGTDSLRALVREIQPAVAAHRNHASGDALLAAAIEENVRNSVRALTTHSDLIRAAVAAGRLRIVGAVHDLATGCVRFLD